MYIPTSTPAGHLFAIDVTTGNIKWVYGIDAITYGGGALIGDDGTIYQCVESKDIDNVHAINSDGTKKWSIKLHFLHYQLMEPCFIALLMLLPYMR